MVRGFGTFLGDFQLRGALAHLLLQTAAGGFFRVAKRRLRALSTGQVEQQRQNQHRLEKNNRRHRNNLASVFLPEGHLPVADIAAVGKSFRGNLPFLDLPPVVDVAGLRNGFRKRRVRPRPKQLQGRLSGRFPVSFRAGQLAADNAQSENRVVKGEDRRLRTRCDGFHDLDRGQGLPIPILKINEHQNGRCFREALERRRQFPGRQALQIFHGFGPSLSRKSLLGYFLIVQIVRAAAAHDDQTLRFREKNANALDRIRYGVGAAPDQTGLGSAGNHRQLFFGGKNKDDGNPREKRLPVVQDELTAHRHEGQDHIYFNIGIFLPEKIHQLDVVILIRQTLTADVFVADLAVGGQGGEKGFPHGAIERIEPVGQIRLGSNNQEMLFRVLSVCALRIRRCGGAGNPGGKDLRRAADKKNRQKQDDQARRKGSHKISRNGQGVFCHTRHRLSGLKTGCMKSKIPLAKFPITFFGQ